VVVVQHGEKEHAPGDPGLTRVGQEQARRTAAWLAGRPRPVAVWSSPLRRAVETAKPLAAALGLDVVVDPRLRERMNWTGTTESLDDFLADWQRASADRTFVPRSGDSSLDAAIRFLDALNDLADLAELADPADLAAAHPAGTAVAVAHGGVTTDALPTVLGDDELSARSPTLVDHGVPSCAVTTFARDGGRWSVPSIAVTHHLGPGQRSGTTPDTTK